jgi:hypothetical protein
MELNHIKYTKEDIAVFRECFVLLKNGCKNDTEAEKKLSIKFWYMPRNTIQKLLKVWFYNREKIDQMLSEYDKIQPTENESGTTCEETS